MKKVFILVFVSLLVWSCGNSNNDSNKKTKIIKPAITQDMIIGEWECVDITNGVAHMESIAKMQPHMIFTKEGKIFSKMKLPDSTFVQQKLANYKIENGVISSEIFEVNPYMENGRLIVEDPSADNKNIYIKK